MVRDVNVVCGGGRCELGGCGMELTGSSVTYAACEGGATVPGCPASRRSVWPRRPRYTGQSVRVPAHVSTYSQAGKKTPLYVDLLAKPGCHSLHGRHLEVGYDGGWVSAEDERRACVSDSLQHLRVDRLALAR